MRRMAAVLAVIGGILLVVPTADAQEETESKKAESSSESPEAKEGASDSESQGETEASADKSTREKTSGMSFEQLAREGMSYYNEKAYAEALVYFERAYGKKKVPDMLYNIGRCYEHMGKTDEAIDYYAQYAEHPEVSTEAKKDALDRIETLKRIAKLKSDEKREKQTKKKAKEGESVKEVSGTTSETTDAGRAPDGGGGGSTVGWILTSVGGASLIGGGAFAILAAGEQTTMNDATALQNAQAARDKGKRFAIYADGMFAGGVVLSGVGVAVLLASGNSGSAEAAPTDEGGGRAAVEIRPLVGSDTVGLTVDGEF